MTVMEEHVRCGDRLWYSESGLHMIVEVVGAVSLAHEWRFTMRVLARNRCDHQDATPMPGRLFTITRTKGHGYGVWHLRTLDALKNQHPSAAPLVDLWARSAPKGP